jgi:sorbitol-specific phosphotransferase system component IIC
MDRKTALYLVGAVVILLFGLISLVISVRLAKKIGRSVPRLLQVFGDTPQSRLIALGVTVFFFPGMITGPLDYLIRLTQTLIATLPTALRPLVDLIGKHSIDALAEQNGRQARAPLK